MPVFLGLWVQIVFGSALNTGTDTEKLPVNFNFYSAFYFLTGKVSLFQRFCIRDFSSRREKQFSAGFSVRLTSEITLSGGKNASETAYGIGINIGRFNFDFSNSVSDLGSRISASLSFDFAYIKDISEKMLKKKKKEIEKLKKQILELKERTDLMTDEERDWLLKMIAQAFKHLGNRQFSKAAATMRDILSRYEYKIKKEEPPITKKQARQLATEAAKLMNERKYTEAKAAITRALKVLQGDPIAEETSHLIDAYIQIEKGNYRLAKSILAEGLVIKPDSEKMIDLMKRIDKFLKVLEIKK
jgi:tetratricopeptide (TPR) repeat protein